MTFQTPAQKLSLSIGDTVIVGVGRKCEHNLTPGRTAIFVRDDGTQSPYFRQGDRHQFLDLTEITFTPARNTPAQDAGIQVGDTVELLKGVEQHYFGGKYTQLLRDDGSEMPRFGNATKSLWVRLEDVRKVEVGPKAGVLWSSAPEGATHYSLSTTHSSKWHKLDTNGKWSYAISDYSKTTGFITYPDADFALVDSQVAIPGICVVVNPMQSVLESVKLLEVQVRGKLQEVDTLQRDVATLNGEKQVLLGQISAAGFSVQGGELVEDTGICVGSVVESLVDGVDIRKGNQYTIHTVLPSHVRFLDDTDYMRTRPIGEVKFISNAKPVGLSKVPHAEWKKGDVVRNVSDRDPIHYDLTIGKAYTLLSDCEDGFVRMYDDVGCPRNRAAEAYVLVKRA